MLVSNMYYMTITLSLINPASEHLLIVGSLSQIPTASRYFLVESCFADAKIFPLTDIGFLPTINPLCSTSCSLPMVCHPSFFVPRPDVLPSSEAFSDTACGRIVRSPVRSILDIESIPVDDSEREIRRSDYVVLQSVSNVRSRMNWWVWIFPSADRIRGPKKINQHHM